MPMTPISASAINSCGSRALWRRALTRGAFIAGCASCNPE
jgi:hypothetical protein